MTAQASFVMSAQLPDGAITSYPGNGKVNPYIGNYAAMGLAASARITGSSLASAAAWKWLTWYQSSENPQGFVSNAVVENGATVPVSGADSTDATSGTFLLAVALAHRADPQLALLQDLAPGIAGAIRAITATQQQSGLTWARPGFHTTYLMDEAEAYAGLLAGAELAGTLGNHALASVATMSATRLAAAVALLWNRQSGAYDWAAGPRGTLESTSWSILYPDAMEQVWAVAFGLATGRRAAAMMERLAASEPTWDQPGSPAQLLTGSTVATGPAGYWPLGAWASIASGNPAAAAAELETISSGANAAHEAWPYTPGTAGEQMVAEASLWQIAAAGAGAAAAIEPLRPTAS